MILSFLDREMIVISHRGNIDGPNPSLENNPKQIEKAISKNFDVEIDVWAKNNKIYLGHDNPQYEINKNFLTERREKLWCHAKNITALRELLILDLNCFWHQSDDVVLTSSGHMWTFPGKELTEKSISVMPEINYSFENLPPCAGYCTDYPSLIGKTR